jgi:hypothetical protein
VLAPLLNATADDGKNRTSRILAAADKRIQFAELRESFCFFMEKAKP